jgi:hypothetical protein
MQHIFYRCGFDLHWNDIVDFMRVKFVIGGCSRKPDYFEEH